MGWFSRKKAIEDRWPAERLSALGIVVGLGAPTGAERAGLSGEDFVSSRFFAGYLLGYPAYADNVSPELGAAVRMMLFHSVYGEQSGNAFYDKAIKLLHASDQQILKGASVGEEDGENYFLAMENGEDATDAGDALVIAFQIGAVDVQQRM